MKALLFVLSLISLSLPLQSTQAGPLRERLQALRQQHQTDALSAPAQAIEIAYGPDPKERYDVYAPHPSPSQATPVIFMVHGGAWRIGDKAHDRVVENKVEYWFPQGIALISVNYPMLPITPPLAQAQALTHALAHAQQHAHKWGLDPQRFVLMGHSAGAHLVALINANPTLAKQAGASPWLGAVVLDSAAMNIPQIMNAPHFSFYDEAFGQQPDLWQKASPSLQIARESRPVLMVCSTRRKASCQQAQDYANTARDKGLSADVFPIDLSHSEINEKVGQPGPLTAKLSDFLRTLDPVFTK